MVVLLGKSEKGRKKEKVKKGEKVNVIIYKKYNIKVKI
jgi:hypothetical protein